MDIKDHTDKYLEIIKKYNLSDDKKAEEISTYLTNDHGKIISAKEFSVLFAMEEKDAEIFLSFIQKGIGFKQAHLDK